MESEINLMPKVSSGFDKSLCIICSKNGDNNLLNTENGCCQIRSAAADRNDLTVVKRLQNFECNETFFYHLRPCYSTYTNSTNLKRIKAKQSKQYYLKFQNSNETIDNTEIGRDCIDMDVEMVSATNDICGSGLNNDERYETNSGSSDSGFMQNCADLSENNSDLCVICDKNKYKGSLKKKQILSETRARHFIKIRDTFSSIRSDIFNRTSSINNAQDLLHNNIYFHEDCLRNLEQQYDREYYESSDDYDSDHSSNFTTFFPKSYSTPLNKGRNSEKHKAIKDAIDQIMPRIRKGECFTITQICAYVEKQNCSSNISVQNSDIKNYLLQNFESEVVFSVPEEKNKSALVYHSSLTTNCLIEKLRNNNLTTFGENLRDELKKADFGLNDRFCDSNDLRHSWENMNISPQSLEFLTALLNIDKNILEKNNNVCESTCEGDEDIKREKKYQKDLLELKTVYQFLFNMIQKGKKLSPLQLITGMSIHASCRSRCLITELNRLGLSCSYDIVQRKEENLCDYTVESCKNKVPLPPHFHEDKFTIAAVDNFDRIETTKAGLETTHDTVFVVFQEASDRHKSKPVISKTNVNKRSRKFKKSLECQELKHFSKPKKDIRFPNEERYNFTSLNISPEEYENVSIGDLAWVLSRMDIGEEVDEERETSSIKINISKNLENKCQETPPWYATYSIVLPDNRPRQIVGFLPILPYPVTKYNTVYTALCNLKNMLSELNQKSLAVFSDEGMYQYLRHIQAVRSKEFKDIFLLIGGFHMAKVAAGCVGKYLRGSGIDHVFIETKTFGIGAVEQALSGSHYSRSLSFLFLLGEVLLRLLLEAFFKEYGTELFKNDLNLIETLQQTFAEEKFDESKCVFEKVSTGLKKVYDTFNKFVERRSTESNLFKYYVNVIRMIQVVRDLIKSDRSGNFYLHRLTVKKLQPLFQAMDRTNYERWGAVYLSDLEKLPDTHPDLYTEFQAGKFTVKQSNKSFSSVAADQALEQTSNRSKKSSGGIISFTQDKNKVTEWDIIRHEVLSISNFLREITLITNDHCETELHHEYSYKKTMDSEKTVQNVISYMKNHLNPFMEGQQPLRNLVTEEIASDDAKDDLLNVFKIGCNKAKTFWDERFVNKSKSINETIPKNNLPHFFYCKESDVEKKKSKRQIEQEKNISQKIFLLATERKYDMKQLFTYELRQEDYLFETEYILKKPTQKSLLLKELIKESNLTEIHFNFLPTDTFCIIVDVMIVCRRVNYKDLKIFKDFAEAFCSMIKYTKINTSRIDFVFDSYIKNSPKAGERLRRYKTGGINIGTIDDNVEIPKQADHFWASDNNKINLQKYLRKYIKQNYSKYWPEAIIILSATDELECESINEIYDSISLQHLQNSNIEEADLRIIIHCNHAVKAAFNRVVVISTDTDVVVLLLHYFETFCLDSLQELWNYRFNLRKTSQNTLPVHVMANKLGPQLCKVLPALHNLTGSDYTSKIGTKQSALKAKPVTYLYEFGQYSSTEKMEDAIQYAENYLVGVMRLKSCSSLETFDHLRHYLYYHSDSQSFYDLPPTSKSIRLHILRAFYVTNIQISCLRTQRAKLDPLNYGYIYDDSFLIPKKVTEIFPPDDELVPACTCKKCSKKSCRCVAAGITCCSFCNCQMPYACKNPYNLVSTSDA